MTTNQTIDGVPRELLSGLLAWLERANERNDDGDIAEYVELRALLEPADHVHEWDINAEGTATVCHCGARSSDEPAAQPHAEPVAEIVSKYGDPEAFGERELIAIKDIQRYSYGTKLYAEQPAPVAVVMSFDFEHPSSKERRTVALSKQDVFDGMEDYFYDKIGEQICRCESVGETNVVDCSCDEYVHDFEIVKASLTS